ncbi:hypothetical protein AAY473_032068 [Plecturocebus cupreus]
MQIKTTMRYHLMPVRMVIIKKSRNLTPVIPALWEAEDGRFQGQKIKTILANLAGLELLNSSSLPTLASQSMIHYCIRPQILIAFQLTFFVVEMEFHFCCPSWSTMSQYRLTTTSASWVQAQWCTPVIPAHLKDRVGGSLEARSLRSAWQHSKSLSPQKSEASQLWWRAPAVPATQEAKEGRSLEPRSCGCSELRNFNDDYKEINKYSHICDNQLVLEDWQDSNKQNPKNYVRAYWKKQRKQMNIHSTSKRSR